MSEFGLVDVEVRYGGVPAVERLTVAAHPGRVTVLVGSDGAGKSTAVKALLGLVPVTTGQVRRPPLRKVGYQPESGGAWLDLTVGENLEFVRRVHDVPDSERVGELLEVTGLTAALHRPASALSGGMRQKLAVAMAILPNPDLVVLDEPTTGLDPVSRAELWRLLFHTAGEGSAVIATTSYLDEAERADHVVVMESGRSIASGTAGSITVGFEGTVAVTPVRPTTSRVWRRGRVWRAWYPSGQVSEGTPVPVTLEDVVTVAALFGRNET